MGQYHLTVALNRKEWLMPHALGYGLKQGEQIWGMLPFSTIIYGLLIAPQPRGGGDLDVDMEIDPERVYLGRWHGERLAIVGDYAQTGDLPLDDRAAELYQECAEERNGWVDISELIRPFVEQLFHVRLIDRQWTMQHPDGTITAHAGGWRSRAFDPDWWVHMFQGASPEKIAAHRLAYATGQFPAGSREGF